MEVRDLGENCYLVGDRVVMIKDNTIDMTGDEGKEILLDIVKRLYEKDRGYSLKHVDVIKLKHMQKGGYVYVLGNCRVKDLPERVQSVLLLISTEYVFGDDVPCTLDSRVRDCGGGVYAMHPQVIHIGNDVYDMYEPYDVDSIVQDLASPGSCKGLNSDPLSMLALRFKWLWPGRSVSYMAGKSHMCGMSEDVMANLREEFPEYADKIRDRNSCNMV